jgi:hypothetical protein
MNSHERSTAIKTGVLTIVEVEENAYGDYGPEVIITATSCNHVRAAFSIHPMFIGNLVSALQKHSFGVQKTFNREFPAQGGAK